MRRHFARNTALIMLVTGFFISVLLTKFYIEDSYAHIAEAGLTGTPSAAGLFVLLLFVWAAGLAVFLVLNLVHTLIHLRDGHVFSGFLKELGVFFLFWLLYFPLAFGAMYAGGMLVKLP